MTYSTECSTCINRAINIAFIDSNMNDDDFVYLHNDFIKVVPHGGDRYKLQKSLIKRLRDKLNNAGRQSLAERTIKKQFITYNKLKSLVHQINKPRTLQTLLTNRYLQWSINHDSFPDFVKDDMRKNNILAIPSNIYDLSRTIFCSESVTHPLILLKHIVTQCMEIEYSTNFDDLKEELADCIRLFLKHSSSTEN